MTSHTKAPSFDHPLIPRSRQRLEPVAAASELVRLARTIRVCPTER